MSDKHTTEALGLLSYVGRTKMTSEEAQAIATAAQVRATLAQAEQLKRIADWLETWPLANDETPVVSVNRE